MFDTGGVTASPSPSLHQPEPEPGTDQRSVLRQLTELIRPVTLAAERRLPVSDPLVAVLPDGALLRGSMLRTTGVGATSLALALIAAASREGSWCAVIGLPELALVAADEHGITMERLALIEVPAWRRCAEVVAALIDGIDLVLLDARASLSAVETRRIAARLREQGSVLIVVDPGLPTVSSVAGSSSVTRSPLSQSAGGWSPDVVLTLGSPRWSGVGQGHGLLRRRRVVIDAIGRGRSARPRRLDVLLPDDHGSVAVVSDALPSITASNTASGDAPMRVMRGHRVAG